MLPHVVWRQLGTDFCAFLLAELINLLDHYKEISQRLLYRYIHRYSYESLMTAFDFQKLIAPSVQQCTVHNNMLHYLYLRAIFFYKRYYLFSFIVICFPE